MFEKLTALPADPILGLSQYFYADTHSDKINLSVGVYQNDDGNTPIFSAVKKAEQQLINQQTSKAYVAQQGDPAFVEKITELTLGIELYQRVGSQIQTVMTPGGSGALRMTAEFIAQVDPNATLWVSDPTWGNHYPLLESAGLTLKPYTYYDKTTGTVNFAGMMDALSQIPEGDMILLHACCHNPTGADLNNTQWDQVIDLLAQRKIVPFMDIAYQGFSKSLEADTYGVRLAIEKLPEVLIASSCSKNFGLYRERIGAAMIYTQAEEQSIAAKTYIMSAARKAYSMSPYHGGGIVGVLLNDKALTTEWQTELDDVRNRVNGLRLQLAEGLNAVQSKINFDFVAKSRGMFCFLGIERDDVLHLRSEYGIYLLESTRINVAGISSKNIDILIDRVSKTLNR